MARKFEKFNFNKELGYVDPEIKKEWHRTAKDALRAFAASMGLSKKDYDIRSNKAGIAVSGEVILHTDTVYIMVSADHAISGLGGILYRRCTGSHNAWADISLLNSPAKMKRELGWIFKPNLEMMH